MSRSFAVRAMMLGLAVALLAPAAAFADTYDAAGKGLPDSVGINSIWVIVAACLVMFMQAGFAFLEIGFSRGKNAGTVVAKILTNFSIAAILYWAVGFAFAFGGGRGHVIGTHGFFLRDFGDPQKAFPIMGLSDATIEAKWFFQFVFCAVSLAIVWGTTLERIKFGVYVIYAIVFCGAHLPDRLALGLRRRLAADQPRHAGLRRFDGGPPDRRDRRPRGAAASRAAQRQVRRRRQAAGDPRPQHAALRPRRPDPVARLVRVQPGLDARTRSTAASRRSCSSRTSPPRRACSARWSPPTSRRRRSTSAWPATARSARSSRSRRPRATSSSVGGVVIGLVAGVIVAARRLRDRQEARRPGRRAHGARPVRHLGHARVRHLHAAGAGGVQRGRRRRA